MRKGSMGRSSVAALVASGLLLAGCGSSSSSSTSKPAGLTKAQYLAQGNAICRNGQIAQGAALNAYLKQAHVNPNARPTTSQLTALVNTVFAPNIQQQLDKLKALAAPSGDQQTVSAMLAAAQQALDSVKKNPPLLFGRPFHPAAKMLHAYGLTACARNR